MTVEERLKKLLDSMTPEEREEFDEMQKVIEARAEELKDVPLEYNDPDEFGFVG